VALEPTYRHFSVEEYERMVAVGILTEHDRVELIEGSVVEMPPIGPLHADVVRRLQRFFEHVVSEHAVVSVQNPIALPPRSEPEPDIALLRPGPYRERHPGPGDVFLVIEVSDASLQTDRRDKIPMYARAGIPEAWLIDLTVERLERYRSPGSDGFASRDLFGPQDVISPGAFPRAVLPLRDVIA
jgi:hypothetical protein